VPDPAVWLEAGAKAVLYGSLLIAIGASALRWLLLPRCAPELGPCNEPLMRSAARLALWAAIGALAACILRVWTHTVAAFGFGDAGWDNLKLIAFQSRWGQAWKVETVGAAILLIACAITARRRAAWPFETLAVLFFTATIPLLGHAAGDLFHQTLHVVHILAAGVWLGTLAVALLVRVPDAERGLLGEQTSMRGVRAQILRRFSPVALSSAGTAVAAGLVASYLYIGSLSNLWATSYGRILLLKVAFVAGVGACGFANWRRLRRPLPHTMTDETVIVLEVVLAVGVILLTGLLTETGHPG
jgi:putative copper export protein